MLKSKRKRLPKTFSIAVMRDVWDASRDKSPQRAGKPGIDGVTAAAFKNKLDENLRDIREALQTGEFRFRRLRIAPIPKGNDRYRIVAVPTVRDRLVQRVVLHHLREVEPNFSAESEVSYGFLKEKSLQDAQKKAQEYRAIYPFVLQTDIERFFDSIPRDQISAKIRRAVRTKCIRDLLIQIVNVELDDRDDFNAKVARDNGIRDGRGLRQGMPASPVLSNLFLRDFDRVLVKTGMKAIRYADDITLFGESKEQCLVAFDVIKQELGKLGLAVPEIIDNTKTKIISATEDVEFLGVVLRRVDGGCRILAPNKALARIEERLRGMSTLDFCLGNQKTLPQVMRTMEATTIGFGQALALAENREDFEKRLEAVRRKSFESLLIDVLGQKTVAALGERERAVLGLAPFPKASKPKA